MTVEPPSSPDTESSLLQRLSELEAEASSEITDDLLDRLRRFVMDSATAGVPHCEVRGYRLLARVLEHLGHDPASVIDALGRATRVHGAGLDEVTFARHEYALALRSEDHHLSVELLEQCVNEFIELEEPRAAAEALLEWGELLGSSGQREGALERFEAAREWARSIGDAAMVAHALDRMAAAHWELGRLDTAEHLLRDALAIWEAKENRGRLAWARYRLGWCLANEVRAAQRGEEALDLLEKARSAARAAGDMSLVASCDEKAAWVLNDRGDLQSSIAMLRSAAAVFDSLGQEGEFHIVRANLANHLLEAGQHEEGEWLFRQVMASKSTSPRSRSSAAARLARHLVRTNRAEEAIRILENHESDVDIDDRTECPRFLLAQAAAFNALSMVQATRSKAEAALQYLDRAVMPRFHAEALEFLARCVDFDGDRRSAEALMGQAVALYLIDGDDKEARRLAREIIPPLPGTERPPPQPSPSVGVYL